MNLTPAQYQTALMRLSLFHILIIASSNYLVQLPITIFGFHTTWGAFSFPFIFLPPIRRCGFSAQAWRARLSRP